MSFEDWNKDLDKREAEYLHVPAPVVDDRPLAVRHPLTSADVLLLLKLDKAFE